MGAGGDLVGDDDIRSSNEGIVRRLCTGDVESASLEMVHDRSGDVFSLSGGRRSRCPNSSTLPLCSHWSLKEPDVTMEGIVCLLRAVGVEISVFVGDSALAYDRKGTWRSGDVLIEISSKDPFFEDFFGD